MIFRMDNPLSLIDAFGQPSMMNSNQTFKHMLDALCFGPQILHMTWTIRSFDDGKPSKMLPASLIWRVFARHRDLRIPTVRVTLLLVLVPSYSYSPRPKQRDMHRFPIKTQILSSTVRNWSTNRSCGEDCFASLLILIWTTVPRTNHFQTYCQGTKQ